jgi:hypothetical protein
MYLFTHFSVPAQDISSVSNNTLFMSSCVQNGASHRIVSN